MAREVAHALVRASVEARSEERTTAIHIAAEEFKRIVIKARKKLVSAASSRSIPAFEISRYKHSCVVVQE